MLADGVDAARRHRFANASQAPLQATDLLGLIDTGWI